MGSLHQQGGISPRGERLIVGRVHEPPQFSPIQEVRTRYMTSSPRTSDSPPEAQLTSSNLLTSSLLMYFPVIAIGTLSPVWIMVPQLAVE